MLYAAAETFSITPKAGSEGESLLHAKVSAVFGPIKTTVTLIRDDRRAVCLISTHFMIEQYALSNLWRNRVACELGLSAEQVFLFSSHNHNDVLLTTEPPQYGVPHPDVQVSEAKLTTEGRTALKSLLAVARRVRKKTVPVRVAWNVGHERRITYNRKGRRADGSTYLMREEDRVLLGKDFSGDIEDDAPVIALVSEDGKPVCFLAHFTGHPATDYHPEHPVVHGDYPQVACDDLSEAFGGVPVGFLQGCAGDLNSKGLLAPKPIEEKWADAVRYGHWLGATYIRTAKHLQYSATDDVAFSWERVQLPFQKVPSPRTLRRQIAEMDDFIRRCAADDETALTCVGLNTARAMSPRYRAALIEPCKRWANWALEFHVKKRLASAPTHVDADVAAIRIGDVGIFGMPCEPLLGIGRQIKRDAKLPLVVPCGYMNDQSIGYVPDKPNNGDMEYQSSFYRYTTSLLPYQDPAGDLLAQAACRMLRDMAGNSRRVGTAHHAH
jgi:hypothetical protein